MRKLIITAAVCSTILLTQAQEKPTEKSVKIIPEMTERWSPTPPVVTPGSATSAGFITPPSDAIVFFDGTDLTECEGAPDTKVSGDGNAMLKLVSSAGKDA